MKEGKVQQLELTEEQLHRLDQIYNGMYEYILLLLGKTDDGFPWDISLIAPLAEGVIDALREESYKVSYPGIIEEKDGFRSYADGTEED